MKLFINARCADGKASASSFSRTRFKVSACGMDSNSGNRFCKVSRKQGLLIEHSPVAWNSFEKQSSVGQTATRRQAYALPFSLGEDRLMWTIVLAKSAASHDRPESEPPRPLRGLDVPLPPS